MERGMIGFRCATFVLEGFFLYLNACSASHPPPGFGAEKAGRMVLSSCVGVSSIAVAFLRDFSYCDITFR